MMKLQCRILPRFRRAEMRPGAAAALGAALTAALLHGTVPLWLLPVAGALGALMFSRRSGIAFAVGMLIVGIGAVGGALTGTNDLSRRLPGEIRRIDLRLRLIDPRLTGVDSVPQPSFVLAETVAFSPPGEERWENISGRCMIRFPDGRRVPPRGSVIEAKGVLRRALPREAVLHCADGQTQRIPFGESFRRHLAARGSECTFTFHDFKLLRERHSGAAR